MRGDQALVSKIDSDIAKLRYTRGIGALSAVTVALAEVGFAAVAVIMTANGSYDQAAIATLVSGLAVTIDNALRLRESATEQHERLTFLKSLRDEVTRPPDVRNTDQWESYRAHLSTRKLDYVTAVLALCFDAYAQ